VTKEEKLKEDRDDYPTPDAIVGFFLWLELRERARDRLFYGLMGLILSASLIACFFLR